MTAEISTDVERLYFALLIAQRQQSGAEAKSKMIESQLQLASAGMAPLGGMAERHAAFLETSKALVTARSKVTELTGSLNAPLGFSPDTELELVAPEPVVETISLTQATQRAMATSPEVVEAEQTVVKRALRRGCRSSITFLTLRSWAAMHTRLPCHSFQPTSRLWVSWSPSMYLTLASASGRQACATPSSRWLRATWSW